MLKSTHIPILDHLRGLAALSVCLFHFSNGNIGFLPSGDPIKEVGALGWLGVEAFFVISGFVIPYALSLRSYRLSDALSFFVRRLKRLEPPYFACILLVIMLQYFSSVSPDFRGDAFKIQWTQLVSHVAYLNAILDFEWLNPVFWTLAIEFQFYIFIALAFPFLTHDKLAVRVVSVLLTTSFGLIGIKTSALLPHWLPLFAIGLVTFQSYVGLLSNKWYATALALISLTSFIIVGSLETTIGVTTALIIWHIASRPLPLILSPLALVGTISYSLYLLHVPIGGRVINLASRLPESPLYRYGLIVVAFVVSIAVALAFWWLIERTSQRWAKSDLARPSSEATIHTSRDS